jgi:hypothetical protein
MELVILSGPGVVMTPTANDARTWAVIGLVCAAIVLADAAVTALMLRRNGSPPWRVSALLPAAIGFASLAFAWRTWRIAHTFPPAPRFVGVTGSDCALCQTLNNYATVGELVIGATLLMALARVVYLLGEVR